MKCFIFHHPAIGPSQVVPTSSFLSYDSSFFLLFLWNLYQDHSKFIINEYTMIDFQSFDDACD